MSGEPTQPKLQVYRVIWIGMFVALIAYSSLAVAIAAEKDPHPLPGNLKTVFFSLAVAAAIGSLLIPRLVAKSNSALASAQDEASFLRAAFTPYVIRLALAETVAIFGLLITLFSQDVTSLWPFATGSGLIFFLSYPTLDNVRGICGDVNRNLRKS